VKEAGDANQSHSCMSGFPRRLHGLPKGALVLCLRRPSILKVKSRFQRRACAPRSSTWSQDVNIPCWLEGIPELLFVHRELTERVTFVFVIVIVPLQITAESGRSVAQRYHC